MTLALALLLLSVWVWRLALADLPATPAGAALAQVNRPPAIAFLDRNGEAIGRRGPLAGEVLRLADLPPYVPQRLPRGGGPALLPPLRRGPAGRGARDLGRTCAPRRIVEGGSTITQQLARTLFLTPDQTLSRKMQEAVLAIRDRTRHEQGRHPRALPEPHLLRRRAPTASTPPPAPISASRRPALTLSEAALLAALPKAPSRLDPTNNSTPRWPARDWCWTACGARAGSRSADIAAARAEPPHLVARAPAGGRRSAMCSTSPPRACVSLRPAGARRPDRAPERSTHGCSARPRLRSARRSRRNRARGAEQARAGGARARRARSGPWSAASTTATAPSTAPSRRAASPARPSSPSSTPPRWRPESSRRHPPRRAGPLRRLGAAELRRRLCRRRDAERGPGPLHQHRGGEAGRGGGRRARWPRWPAASASADIPPRPACRSRWAPTRCTLLELVAGLPGVPAGRAAARRPTWSTEITAPEGADAVPPPRDRRLRRSTTPPAAGRWCG